MREKSKSSIVTTTPFIQLAKVRGQTPSRGAAPPRERAGELHIKTPAVCQARPGSPARLDGANGGPLEESGHRPILKYWSVPLVPERKGPDRGESVGAFQTRRVCTGRGI
jgi:hypothetical protein